MGNLILRILLTDPSLAMFGACLQIEDDARSNLSCLAANPGTPLGSASASCQKCLFLFVFVKPEGPAKKDFMYFGTERVTNPLREAYGSMLRVLLLTEKDEVPYGLPFFLTKK
jgi:hypothetical protein